MSLEKRMKKLANKLFEEECIKANLSYKLDLHTEKSEDLKQSLLALTGYPDKEEIYEFSPYVIRIIHGDIQIYTQDQYEKVEGFIQDERDY